MGAKRLIDKNKVTKKANVMIHQESDSSDEDVDLEEMEEMLEEDESSEEDDDENEDEDIEKNLDDLDEDESSMDEDAIVSEEDEDGESSDEEIQRPTIEITGDEKCTLDLRNLLAINSHQVNYKILYNTSKGEAEESKITIDVDGTKKVNEAHLLQLANEGCAQLLAGLWQLDTEKTDVGPMATLPSYYEIVTPRALPPPTKKEETRWEKFAKERGIGTKEKRSRKVWDEDTQTWAYRTGLQKAVTSDMLSWPILEVKKNDDPMADPWEKVRDAKKDRVEKNIANRMKNAERTGDVERGTTRRLIKAQTQDRLKGREGGRHDTTDSVYVPAGIPMDMADKKRGKSLTKAALLATQRSTASMGKFDMMREGEPERRKAMTGLKKRKFESGTSKDAVKNEANKSLKILGNVIAGGGKAKERAIRRGDLSKGESGHDYDFDDGLGPSTFRKKKGRAGIGKMKKVTKKTAKMAR